MMRAWLVACFAASSTACIIPGGGGGGPDEEYSDTTGGDPQPSACIVAATPGGDGAPGGRLSIRSSRSPLIEGVLSASGGEPGKAGQHHLGPPAETSLAGDAGTVEVLEDAGYNFDRSSVPTGSLISIGVPGQSDVLPEGSAPFIAVERLELGDGAVLGLSRYPTIIALDLRIAAGAQLVLRDTGADLVSTDPTELAESSLAGGSVQIIARTVSIAGSLDASGNDGAPGGFGGDLRLVTEELTVGPAGSILADGGSGTLGIDEHECP
jgi:hypothetical protein